MSTLRCRIVQFYNGIQYSEIFTLAVFVVRRFEGPDASEQTVGQLAGLLVSSQTNLIQSMLSYVSHTIGDTHNAFEYQIMSSLLLASLLVYTSRQVICAKRSRS